MSPPGSSRTLEILLVEDDPEDVLLTRAAFKRCASKHRLNVVADGEEAMAYLRRQRPFEAASRPDLVLLDLNLPRMDGREVLAAIRKDPVLGPLPVLVLTTSDSDRDVERAYALHANGYFIKPSGFDQLVELVRSIEDLWMRFARLPSLKASSP